MEFEELPSADQERIELLLIERDPSKSLEGWREIAHRCPRYLSGRLNFAVALLDGGDHAAAREQCRLIRVDFGDNPKIDAQLALIELADGAHADALALADAAIAAGYCWPPLYLARAEALAALGEFEKAKPVFLEAYELSPHGWNALEKFCQLSKRAYTAPGDEPPCPIDVLARWWLYSYIDATANTPDETGAGPGCNHTLRFVRQWSELTGVDRIDLYQFLNGRGGFCDCEVIFNVESRDAAYERLAIAGGVIGDSDRLRAQLAEVARATDEPPPIMPDEYDEEEEDYGDDEAPPTMWVTTRGPLQLWPQLVTGRQWGFLVQSAFDTLADDALFWAVVVAPDDERAVRLFVLRDRMHRVWRVDGKLPSDIPADIASVAENAIADITDALPPPSEPTWSAPLSMPPARPNMPRLLFHGDEGLKVAYADGELIQDLGLTGYNPAPSPSGRYLAYTSIGATDTLICADVVSGEHRRIARGEYFGDLSWANESTLVTNAQRYLVTSEAVVLDDATSDDVRPSGLPDGARVWDSEGDLVVFTEVVGDRHCVRVLDVRDGHITELTEDTASCYWPSLTDDARHVVFSHAAGDPLSAPCRIARVDVGGSNLCFVSDGPKDNRPVVHKATGWIAFQRRDPQNRQRVRICTIAPSGTVHEFDQTGSEATWWPD